MVATNITQERARSLIQLVRQQFPNWNDYEDPRLIAEELKYKRQAIEKASELLPKELYEELLQSGEFDEILVKLKRIAQAGKNLLYLASPRSSDISVVFHEQLNKEEFCRHFYQFLFGEQPSPHRLGEMADYLIKNQLPARWAFLTYYLFVYHPTQDLFCKPTVIRWFLTFLGNRAGLPTPPSREAYAEILDLCAKLMTMLNPRPRDMVDLHSLIWVAFSEQGKQLGSPFNEIFENWEQATQAFEILAYALEKLGVTSPDDQRYAITLPGIKSGRRCLRLDFGRGTPIDFERKAGSVTMVHVDLAGKFECEPRFNGWLSNDFVRLGDENYLFNLLNENDPTLARYTLPVQRFFALLEDTQSRILEKPLLASERTYREWRSNPYRRHNIEKISRAVFDSNLRERVLREGLQAPDEPTDTEEIALDAVFSPKAYELLEGIHAAPQYTYYREHEDEFKQFVEDPFRRLMAQVVQGLPEAILSRLETQRDLFSRFYKNDFGRGGSWDFFWGALYPRDGRRTADPQLALWMNYEKLVVSFYIGDYGEPARQRFRRNCLNYGSVLPNILPDLIQRTDILLSPESAISLQQDGGYTASTAVSWQDWFRDPGQSNFGARVYMTRQEVLNTPADVLVNWIRDIFITVFPLLLLALEEDPLPAIKKFLGHEENDGASINETYSLETMAAETGIEQTQLEHWVKSIHHKGQAVIYGPPGTGKTYLAERLARHLIGGGDGIFQVVQFHPEYSYEDFMQGIRPRPHPSGGLDYPMEAGRFKEFCNEAASRKGVCVLVIDEINRANLARVFGELMFLLEYRDRSIPLAGGGLFKIPSNVRIIGTMNTADRSIALVDHALRRRFAFLGLFPDYQVLRRYHRRENTGFDPEPLIAVLTDLNAQIRDRHYMIGVSYFLQQDIRDRLEDIWRLEIEPYLEEYFYGQEDKVRGFRWDIVKSRL